MSGASKPVVCYHYPCPDGGFAALAAALRFGPAGARFVPMTVTSKQPERLAIADSFSGSDIVYLCDYSGGQEFILRACSRAARVVLLDHHKTAAEDMAALDAAGARPGNLEVGLDMNRSGCRIAFDYFGASGALSPTAAGLAESWTAEDQEGLMAVVALVEDNDLWRHALPGSKAVAAAIARVVTEWDPAKAPDLWSRLLRLRPGPLIAAGETMLAEQEHLLTSAVATAVELHIPTDDSVGVLKCLGIYATDDSLGQVRSELGNRLARLSETRGLAAAGAIIYSDKGVSEDDRKVSLRALPSVDVSTVCRKYGGGGHAGAASCVVKRSVAEGWRAASTGGGSGSSAAIAVASVPVPSGAPFINLSGSYAIDEGASDSISPFLKCCGAPSMIAWVAGKMPSGMSMELKHSPERLEATMSGSFTGTRVTTAVFGGEVTSVVDKPPPIEIKLRSAVVTPDGRVVMMGDVAGRGTCTHTYFLEGADTFVLLMTFINPDGSVGAAVRRVFRRK